MPSAPGAPSAPLPALSVTRTRFTADEVISAARLEPPAAIALGVANETSSMVTDPVAAPATESAYRGDGEITCALPPTYDQIRPARPDTQESPPYTLTAVVTF